MKVSVFALLLFSAGGTAYSGESLQLSIREGKAPLTVSVAGPSKLVQLGKGTYSKWVGCGFNIDWGDSHPAPFDRDCGKRLEHVYEKPGTYSVKASTFHANPDDSHTTDWSDDARVVVK